MLYEVKLQISHFLAEVSMHSELCLIVLVTKINFYCFLLVSLADSAQLWMSELEPILLAGSSQIVNYLLSSLRIINYLPIFIVVTDTQALKTQLESQETV